MNIENILNALHQKINATSSIDEILILSKAIERLNVGTVKTVSTYSNLPNDVAFKGEVYFVEDEEKLYYSVGSFWFSILDTANLIAYAWGFNANGRLADGTISSRSSPVSIIGGFTDWIQVDAGLNHAHGLRANGTIWGWGINTTGYVGDGTFSNRSSPVNISSGYNDWIQVNAMIGQGSALRRNGEIWVWGNESPAKLPRPSLLTDQIKDFEKISNGRGQHAVALRSNGTLWSWGKGTNGQLGDDNSIDRSSPVSVVGGFTDWIDVGSGRDHSMGIRSDGTAWTWGRNQEGQLGDNTNIQKSSPVSVVGGFTDWVQLKGGGPHTVGLRSNGTIWGWGTNTAGQLGDNTIITKSSPVSVVGGFTDWVFCGIGRYTSFGIRSNGTAWAWGNQTELPDGTTINRSSPVSIVGGFTNWIQISGGFGVVGG